MNVLKGAAMAVVGMLIIAGIIGLYAAGQSLAADYHYLHESRLLAESNARIQAARAQQPQQQRPAPSAERPQQ